MKISKTSILFLVFLFPLMVGCASSGMRKPTVFVDKSNNIPADIPLQFDSRYERLISDKEMEAFHKLQTDDERQDFQDKFWLDRDPNPSTPENERKDEIDDRIDNIAGEIFFRMSGTTGLLFRSNGGFRGDMAKVYLLHGEPNAMDIIDGRSFADLMLWIYGNPENGNILYAFLFYRQGGGGSFELFPQDLYKFDPCRALNEIAVFKDYAYLGAAGNQSCPPNVQQVLWELQTATGQGGLNGNIFAWALINFSSDSSLQQGEALEPPKPASELAGRSNARVAGEAPELVGKAGTDFILASCESCNSMIPAELSLGERFTIIGFGKNFDWVVKGEQLELSLKYRIVLQDHDGGRPIVMEGMSVIVGKKSSLVENPDIIVVVDLLGPEQVAAIPSGKYSVSVYIKNVTPGLMTKKYNSWDKEFVKQ